MTSRRLVRIIVRTGLVVLLLLVGCTAGAWAMSDAAAQYVPSTPNDGGWRIRSSRGRLEIYHYQPPLAGLLPFPGAMRMLPTPNPAPFSGVTVMEPHWRNLWEVGSGSIWTDALTIRYSMANVRYLLLLLIFGGAASIFVAALYATRPRHRRPGFCPTCGCDVRASPERCPECGVMARVEGNGSARIRTENQGIMSPLL